MYLFNLLAEEGSNTTAQPEGSNIPMIIVLGLLIVGFIVMTVVQNKQRKKQMAEEQEKKESLCAGTTVITIGGIMGTVVSVDHNENTFVLDTEGTIMKFDKRAIYQMTLPAGAKPVEKPVVEDNFDKSEAKKDEKAE